MSYNTDLTNQQLWVLLP